jgi:hypothetical protein
MDCDCTSVIYFNFNPLRLICLYVRPLSVYFLACLLVSLERVDPGDRGSEYRSLIGIPGGVQHPLYSQMEGIASAAGFSLKAGKGDDPDTFGKALVYVYDTKDYPFYRAEVYHQFHNDFQSPPYGRAYNNIANEFLDAGLIASTGCPDRV